MRASLLAPSAVLRGPLVAEPYVLRKALWPCLAWAAGRPPLPTSGHVRAASSGRTVTFTPRIATIARYRRWLGLPSARVGALGALDIGQAVIVQQGHVLGVEAAEGTDRLIERCAGLRLDGEGGVLVKIAKPGQERRIDLPTIGTATVAAAAAAGLRGIAVEAGGALVVDPDRLAAAADEAGLFVIAIAVES